MEFLKEILGEELFNQVAEKINAYNGNDANKDKQIKVGNLGTGEYVGKAKYEALEALLKGKETELTTANGLIAELKKGTKGNEELQGKITGYETQVADLQKQLEETKIKSAVKVGLLAEHCTDVDYVTFKLMESLKEKGETLELDENENIKGWNDKLSGLKTQLPGQFGSGNGTKMKVLGDGKLPGSDGNEILTKSELLKKPYAERAKIAQETPELYKAAMNS